MSSACIEKVLLEGYTLRQLASNRLAVGLPALRYRFRQALGKLVGRSQKPRIPQGTLVLLADGIWFRFHGRPWVLYLTALKGAAGKRAVFLDPLMFPGKEGASGWSQAVARIPRGARSRIRALVVDNLPGMKKLARLNGWILQLCQFHLLLKLQINRRVARYSLKGGPIRREIHALVLRCLTLPEGHFLDAAVRDLRARAEADCGTARIQTTIREFVEQIDFYRSCRQHPHLNLPSTNNTVESMGRLIREMFRRNRAGSNPDSILLWATAFIRMRRTIACNGHFNRKP